MLDGFLVAFAVNRWSHECGVRRVWFRSRPGSPMKKGRFVLGTFRSERMRVLYRSRQNDRLRVMLVLVQIDITPPQQQFTCRNCGGGDRGRVAIYRPFGEVSLSLNRTVTCMVLKANDRRTFCPCHDEFRGPRSDYVRQVALATTTTTTKSIRGIIPSFVKK
ncbi:uncharacterized protein TNCV_2112361 [Trichonephila clavipes]|nr:uncharacterized protein TNCV_2112361 [Trichonephila clavipes]